MFQQRSGLIVCHFRKSIHSTDPMSNAATIATAVVIVVDIWAVPYVIELQLKLSNLNVFLCKFVLQSPQLFLLPEEHPQELQSKTYKVTHI